MAGWIAVKARGSIPSTAWMSPSDAAAESLSKRESYLFLNSLTELSDAAAERLSKSKCGFALESLTSLSDSPGHLGFFSSCERRAARSGNKTRGIASCPAIDPESRISRCACKRSATSFATQGSTVGLVSRPSTRTPNVPLTGDVFPLSNLSSLWLSSYSVKRESRKDFWALLPNCFRHFSPRGTGRPYCGVTSESLLMNR